MEKFEDIEKEVVEIMTEFKIKEKEISSLKKSLNDLENQLNQMKSVNEIKIIQVLSDARGIIQTATVEALAPFIAEQDKIEKNTNEQFVTLERQLLPLLQILRSQHKPQEEVPI